jgi:hypothetical protein
MIKRRLAGLLAVCPTELAGGEMGSVHWHLMSRNLQQYFVGFVADSGA